MKHTTSINPSLKHFQPLNSFTTLIHLCNVVGRTNVIQNVLDIHTSLNYKCFVFDLTTTWIEETKSMNFQLQYIVAPFLLLSSFSLQVLSSNTEAKEYIIAYTYSIKKISSPYTIKNYRFQHLKEYNNIN